ncbi:MAG: DUF3857 domain-containing protein [Myxococcota bacterium]
MNTCVRSLLVAALLMSACAGQPDFGPLRVPKAPQIGKWPEVGAAVLDDRATLTYQVVTTADGPRVIAVIDHRRRIKILGEVGLSQSKIELTTDDYSTVANIRARSVGPEGDVETMDSRRVRSRRHPSASANDKSIKVVTFDIPGAVVGGLIEYRYERIILDADFVEPWAMGGRLPRVRSQLDVVTPAGLRIEYRTGDGERLTEERPLRRTTDDGGERLVFVRKDVAPYYVEPRMVHPLRLVPWVASVVVEAELEGGKRRLQTWEQVRSRIEKLVVNVGSGGQGSGSPEERFAQVRDRVRGLDFSGLATKTPTTAMMLMNGEAGTSRDVAALLNRRMRKSELPAYYALLTSDVGPPLLEGLPSVFPFVHAVVAVDVSERNADDASCREDPINQGLLCTVAEDTYAFLDPLCRSCRFGELPLRYTGGRALVFKPGRAEWVDVPQDAPQRNRRITQWVYRLSIEGQLDGKMSGKLTGEPARVVRGALALAETDRDAPAEDVLVGSDTSVEMSKTRYPNLDQIEQGLELKARVASEAKKLGYERFQIRPVDLVGPSLPGRWRFSRRSPSLLPGPSWTETAASVELPVGYEVELPDVVKVVTPFAEYAAGYALRQRNLTFTRRLILKARRVNPDDWDVFRSFLAQVEAVEAEGVVVGFEER